MISLPTIQYERPALTPEEAALPIARFYDRPIRLPGLLQQILLDHPLNPEDVPAPFDFERIIRREGYDGSEYGYCMMPDGSGYVATYNLIENCTPEMLDWWFPWMSTKAKHQPPDAGNIRYKVWCPYGHYDHGLKLSPDGNVYMCATEALDLCTAGEAPDNIYMHPLDPQDFGLTENYLAELRQLGISVNISYETFDYPGMHLCMQVKRLLENGKVEMMGREWMGYGVRDGKIVREPATPVDEAFLREVVLHCTTEMLHLDDILPEIYNEYHDRPIDAD